RRRHGGDNTSTAPGTCAAGTAMRTTWTFHSAGQLLFGRNAARQVSDLALRFGYRRILIVTDPVLVKAGVAERVHIPLSESGVRVEVFSEGEPEPSLRAAAECA